MKIHLKSYIILYNSSFKTYLVVWFVNFPNALISISPKAMEDPI